MSKEELYDDFDELFDEETSSQDSFAGDDAMEEAVPQGNETNETAADETVVSAGNTIESDVWGPSDYIKEGRKLYRDKTPRHWDEAYANYTAEEAAPIMEANDRVNVVNILNHGKYNRKIIRFSIIAFIISIVGIVLLDRIDLFHIKLGLKILFIALEAVLLVLGIYTHRRNQFSTLHWLLPGMSVIWCLYLLFWIV